MQRLIIGLIILIHLIAAVPSISARQEETIPCDPLAFMIRFGRDIASLESLEALHQRYEEMIVCPDLELLQRGALRFIEIVQLMLPPEPKNEIMVSLPSNPVYEGIPIGGQYADQRHVERAADVAPGVERGLKEDGTPYIGSLDAPIVIGVFMDFACLHCINYAPEIDRVIQDFVRSGQARIEIYLFPLVSSMGNSGRKAAQAAICAEQQGAFWEMYNALLTVFSKPLIDEFTSQDAQEIANQIGLDGSAIEECLESNMPAQTLRTAQELFTSYALNAVPSVLYHLADETTWNTIPENDHIYGARSYEILAALIQEANQ